MQLWVVMYVYEWHQFFCWYIHRKQITLQIYRPGTYIRFNQITHNHINFSNVFINNVKLTWFTHHHLQKRTEIKPFPIETLVYTITTRMQQLEFGFLATLTFSTSLLCISLAFCIFTVLESHVTFEWIVPVQRPVLLL